MIPAPNPSPKRRVIDLEWPPYRYVPGCMPHPIRHPDGHLYGTTPHTDQAPIDIHRTWLRGLDLYDGRFYWEAHEVWEASWKQMPKKSVEREAMTGLIQLAAATLKIHMKHISPAQHLLVSAQAHFNRVIIEQGPLFQGVSLPLCHRQVTDFKDGGNWPRIVESA